ncbi:MAG: glycosyltransferase [Pirellulales bacterium]|nr:glycosyltransferase [Pirellulales bacterium]
MRSETSSSASVSPHLDPQPPGERTCVIVVPCYNEAERLDFAAFESFECGRCRFVFVDDGSRDATAEVLDRLCRAAPDRFSMVRLERNRGKAEAVRQGILHALDDNPRLVGYWDADLATPLDVIPQFCRVLDERPEVQLIMGSRVRLLGRSIQRHAVRHYVGRLFATAASLVLNLPVYDTQCGAKILRVTEQTRPLFAKPFRASWAFDVELLARYLAVHGRPAAESPWVGLYEMPLERWEDVRGSKLSILGGLTAFRGLAYVFWHYRMRKGPVASGLTSQSHEVPK